MAGIHAAAVGTFGPMGASAPNAISEVFFSGVHQRLTGATQGTQAANWVPITGAFVIVLQAYPHSFRAIFSQGQWHLKATFRSPSCPGDHQPVALISEPPDQYVALIRISQLTIDFVFATGSKAQRKLLGGVPTTIICTEHAASSCASNTTAPSEGIPVSGGSTQIIGSAYNILTGWPAVGGVPGTIYQSDPGFQSGPIFNPSSTLAYFTGAGSGCTAVWVNGQYQNSASYNDNMVSHSPCRNVCDVTWSSPKPQRLSLRNSLGWRGPPCE